MKGIDYTSDVGNLHVIDYYLHREAFDDAWLHVTKIYPTRPADRFDPSDWTRYDGDLL